jgi:hypothetical protein
MKDMFTIGEKEPPFNIPLLIKLKSEWVVAKQVRIGYWSTRLEDHYSVGIDGSRVTLWAYLPDYNPKD